MGNNKEKKSTSSVLKSVGRGGSHVTRQMVNNSRRHRRVNRQTSTRFRATRTEEIWLSLAERNRLRPSLAERNVAGGPVVEHPEAPSGTRRPTTTKAPSKILNEEGVNAERAVRTKHQRAGHLGELRKR